MKKLLFLLLLIVVIGAAGAYAYATRHPAMAPISRPSANSFDKALVERGEELAGIGNCGVCHTRQGGRPYAGGLPLPTPFGTIHTTNITPDVETGIGGWSEAAFIRALREGVDRAGRHLYPAFPYDYFTKTTDEDLKAIYAYLMTRPPVVERPTQNSLRFPFNVRLLMEGWNFLFLKSGPFVADASKDKEWNRGAYLVEGLGHCGACHTGRNIFGAAAKAGDAAYGGGEAEGWYVPPLNARTPAPVPWTKDTLVNYLLDGWDKDHGAVAGPMAPIVGDLSDQPEDDVYAIATYVMSLKGGARPQAEQDRIANEAKAFAAKREWGSPDNPPVPNDPLLQQGAKVFEGQCSSCHKVGSNPAPLGLATSVHAPDPSNLIRVVFQGLQAPPGARDRSMPARAIQINDADMVALAAFIRNRFSTQPAWTGLDAKVREARAPAAH